MTDKEITYCSFCKRPNNEVFKMVKGPDSLAICNECVDICVEYVNDGNKENDIHIKEPEKKQMNTKKIKLVPPKEIYDELSKIVIGQDFAKKAASVALYKHFLHLQNSATGIGQENEVILFIGPSGCGKSLMSKTIGELFELPFSSSDATPLTEAGYVGEDVEIILANHIAINEESIDSTEKGIIYIDEIDKIARKSQANLSLTRDISGEGVQQALLKILAGGKIRIDPKNKRKNPESNFVTFDTSNILFICGGCFDGIEKVVFNRLNRESNNKLSVKDISLDELYRQIIIQDLIEYGIIPELAGRFTMIVPFQSLTEDDLFNTLKNSDNSILKKYINLFQKDNKEISFNEEFIQSLSKIAYSEKLGARMLVQLVNGYLNDLIFNVAGSKKIKKIILDSSVLDNNILPKYFDGNGSRIYSDSSHVFFSYSRQDEKYVEEFKKIISPCVRGNVINVWYDKNIKPGQKWRIEIDQALKKTKVAILFVSPNFLCSDFIMDKELPYFLEQASNNKITILWILIEHCMYDMTDISKYQAVHNIAKPISMLEKSSRSKLWTDVCRLVLEKMD